MKVMEGYQAALARKGAFRWAEVNAQARKSVLVSVDGESVTGTAANAQTAFYVRANGGKTGYAYTQDMEENPEQVIKRALENGRHGERVDGDVLAQGTREEDVIEASASIDEMRSVGTAFVRSARQACGAILSANADVRVDTLRSQVCNSEGLDVRMARRVWSVEVSTVAEYDGERYNADAHVTGTSPDALDANAVAQRVAAMLDVQRNAGDLASGTYDAVLDSSVMINILTTAWQLFCADKAANGTSALSGKLHERVGSAAVSITDRVRRAGCGYVFPVDDEGCPGRDVALIESGMLQSFLHTQASARAANEVPTGNSGRVALLTGGIPTELIVVPKVFCMEPGNHSREELIKAMGDGVLIGQSYDVFHSINIASGDFSIPCRGALVSRGQIVRNVTGMTMSGNVLELLKSIEEVGCDLWIDEFLLKSYCIGAPSVLVRGLKLSGKG